MQRISIRCKLRNRAQARRLDRVPARIARRPAHGRILGVSRRRNLVRYRARGDFQGSDRFVVVRRGADALRVEARNAGGRGEGTVSFEVRPWRMRALGDSATAGFGFLGDGTEITAALILSCSPPETFNNDRCSSNSPAGPATKARPRGAPTSASPTTSPGRPSSPTGGRAAATSALR